jgi:hypothetical protein
MGRAREITGTFRLDAPTVNCSLNVGSEPASFKAGGGNAMSRRARIGELLSRIVPLSGHDVDEILHEQSANRMKFGEIALSWGLCRPEHLWDAWCQQSSQESQVIDLERVGIDSRAVSHLNGEMARQFNVIPVRVASDVALIAIADTAADNVVAELTGALRRQIKFIRADREQIKALIHRYYPLPV